MSRRKRITDTARLDWLMQNKAEVTHQPNKVGPGWIQEEAWFVRIDRHTVESGATLRSAIDDAMSQESLTASPSETEEALCTAK